MSAGGDAGSAVLRAEFEAWYDRQPSGRLQPWDVWQAAQAAAVTSGHACVWALDHGGNLYRRYKEPQCQSSPQND